MTFKVFKDYLIIILQIKMHTTTFYPLSHICMYKCLCIIVTINLKNMHPHRDSNSGPWNAVLMPLPLSFLSEGFNVTCEFVLNMFGPHGRTVLFN